MPAKRRINVRSLVLALDGPERPFDVYRFSRGKQRFERPRHNPFAGLADVEEPEPEPEPEPEVQGNRWASPDSAGDRWASPDS